MNIDFQSLWYEHKRFVLSVGLGLAVLSILLSVSASIEASADTLRRTNADLRTKIEDGVDKLDGNEGRALGLSKALGDTALPKLLAAVEWKTDEAYRVPDDETNPYSTYVGLKPEAVAAVEKAANRRNVSFPKDLSFRDEIPNEEVAEALVRLDVARAVAIGLIEAGATKIRSIDQRDAIVEKLTGSGDEGIWVRRLPLRVAWEGRVDTIYTFLRDFQKDGRTLLVERFDAQVQRDGKIECEAFLTAIETLDGPPTTADAGAEAGGRPGRERPGRPGRRRPGGGRRF